MLSLDKSGSDLNPLAHLFLDNSGIAFRRELARAFSFASQIEQKARILIPNHKLELWDQAISYQLRETEFLNSLFMDGTSVLLEKDNSHVVWKYGFNIQKQSSNTNKRKWVLPDGLIKTKKETIAVEFDHGKSIGRWANQLLKALRILSAGEIDGVIYCFCFEQDLKMYLKRDELTNEFISLVERQSVQKKIGVTTIFPNEWKKHSVNKERIEAFFINAYLENPSKSLNSKEGARKLLSAFQFDNQIEAT